MGSGSRSGCQGAREDVPAPPRLPSARSLAQSGHPSWTPRGHPACLLRWSRFQKMLSSVRRRVLNTTRAACATLPTSILAPLAVSAPTAFHRCAPRLADEDPSSSSSKTSFGA
jgi:hypothetical protein